MIEPSCWTKKKEQKHNSQKRMGLVFIRVAVCCSPNHKKIATNHFVVTHPNEDVRAFVPTDGPAATLDSAAVRQRPATYHRHRSSHPAGIAHSNDSVPENWSHALDSVCRNRNRVATSVLVGSCDRTNNEVKEKNTWLEVVLKVAW